MGKKYIIEKDDNESIWSIYADADGDTTIEGVSLTPYIELDLEQVRKEAYEQGRKDGRIEGHAEVWACVKKIACMDSEERKKIFGENLIQKILDIYSVSEVIEKIRLYEQENQFCVGDEFENESGKRFVIVKMDGTEIDRYIDEEGKTYCMIAKYEVMRKTGRHFHEIASVLEKMRGE